MLVKLPGEAGEIRIVNQRLDDRLAARSLRAELIASPGAGEQTDREKAEDKSRRHFKNGAAEHGIIPT